MVEDPRKLQADVLPTGHESRSSAPYCVLSPPSGHLLYPSEASSPFSRVSSPFPESWRFHVLCATPSHIGCPNRGADGVSLPYHLQLVLTR